MNSTVKEMYDMASLNGISHERLGMLLFTSYRARLENLRKMGVVPEKTSAHDLRWLILLFLQDRGFISDITSARLSDDDEKTGLSIIGLVLEYDRLRQCQKNTLQKLHRRRLSTDAKLQMIQLVEDIEVQLDNIDDFIGTFCRHIQARKNRETEIVWGSFVQNRTLDRILSRGTELTGRQPRPVPRET